MGDFCVTDVVTRTPIWRGDEIYMIGIREKTEQGDRISWFNSTYDFLGLLSRAVASYDNSDRYNSYDWDFVVENVLVRRGEYDTYGCLDDTTSNCRDVFGFLGACEKRYFYVRADVFDRIAPEGKTTIHRLLKFVRFCFEAHIPLFFDQVLGLQYPWDHDLRVFELRERLTRDALLSLQEQFADEFGDLINDDV